jgi:hypothetical protein
MTSIRPVGLGGGLDGLIPAIDCGLLYLACFALAIGCQELELNRYGQAGGVVEDRLSVLMRYIDK